MRKSDLHPMLQESSRPVPGRSGCYAVIPPAPAIPRIDSPLWPLASREMQMLAEASHAEPDLAALLLRMLNRREAVDSSQIEGTHTQFDELLLHELEVDLPGAVSNPDADRTLNYVRAYAWGAQQVEMRGAGALDVTFICELHQQLMQGDVRAEPGKLRTIQNFIGGMRMENAAFIPPPPGEVPRLMHQFELFLRNDPDPDSHYEFSVLSRAPVIHAHFEAIHPFVDGNGRVGRLLFPLMFVVHGELPIHLATFLKLRQREYYDALLDVQMHLRWNKWIELFLECTIASCRHTTRLLRGLGEIEQRWRNKLNERRTRKHATSWRLVEVLLGQPIVTAGEVAKRLNITFSSANEAIAVLTELDILRVKGNQRRNRSFQAHEVMNLLYTGVDSVLTEVATLHNYGRPRQ